MGMEDIFGGSEQQSTLTKSQRKVLNKLSDAVIPEIGVGAEVYQGPTVAGQNPLMQQAYNQAPQTFGLNQNIYDATNQALSGAGDPEGVRAMYESALDPARLEFQRALNQVGNQYGDTWGSSGALPEMLGRTTAEYGMGLNNLLGNLTYNDRQAGMDRQVSAIPQAIGLEQQENQNLAGLYGLGQEQRAIQEQGMQSDYSKWLSGQWYSNPALGLTQPILGTSGQVMTQDQGLVGAAQGVRGLFSTGILGEGGGGS